MTYQPKPTDEVKVHNLLHGIPDSMEEYRRIPRQSIKPNDVAGLIRDMESYEDDVRRRLGVEADKALFTRKGGQTHPERTEVKTEAKKPRDMSKVTCYNSQQLVHMARMLNNHEAFKLLWDDLESCGQPQPTDEGKVHNLLFPTVAAFSTYRTSRRRPV